jgi:hypothetical protein
VTQFLTPGLQAQVEVTPKIGPRQPGVWTWRVRAIDMGRGAGQWSEARPFTPVWK